MSMESAGSGPAASSPEKAWINRIHHLLNSTRLHEDSCIAVFDLDNTLLIHDIGDAVFTLLRRRSLSGELPGISSPLPFSWPQYRQLLESGQRKEAYCRVVQAMAGLPLDYVAQATRDIMNGTERELEADNVQVPVPRPDPVMQTLKHYLEENGFEIFLISASNQVTVRTLAAEFLDIAADHCWGILPVIGVGPDGKEIFTPDLTLPIPYAQGKVELYQRELKDRAPLVSAGDSLSDIPLLNLTAREGIVIWAGEPSLLNRRPSPFRYPGNVLIHQPDRTV